MKKNIATFNVANHKKIKQQILSWSNQFKICCFFDDCKYEQNLYHTYDCLVGVTNSIDEKYIAKDELKKVLTKNNGWLFGNISYEFKNELFDITSCKNAKNIFPNFFLFEPEIVLYIKNNELIIESTVNCNVIFETIIKENNNVSYNKNSIEINQKITKEKYIETVEKLKQHIQLGDCYEINFCQEFYADNVELNPFETYLKLQQISPTPFSAFYKLEDKYLLCASPERFIKKEGRKLISQPIKGTAKRNLLDKKNDEEIIENLKSNQKERSENIMIVDLVRNDLSKICKRKSVIVEELMGVYSFKQVHQMISTITGEMKADASFYDVLKALFPMGSMTGAPKYKVMELIDEYESSIRNIYSGSVGYITPNGDFDFNVVIRSIVYDSSTKHLNYHVGSAITIKSNAEDEYEECLLKAMAMNAVLNS